MPLGVPAPAPAPAGGNRPAPRPPASPPRPPANPGGAGTPSGPGGHGMGIPAPTRQSFTPNSMLLRSLMNAQTMGAEAANRQLDFEGAFADIAYRNDLATSQLGANSDLARLGNARFRDVDLAARQAEEMLQATVRGVNTSNEFAGRRFGDIQFDATGQRDLALARLRDALGLAGVQYQQGNQFAGADRDLAMRRAALQMSMQQRAATNDAAARGAGTSTGLRDTRNEIQAMNDLDRLGAQNAFTRETYGNRLRLDDATAANRRGIDEANFGFESRMRNSTTDRDSVFAQNANTLAEAQERRSREQAMIDSIAKDYGVNENQIREGFRLGAERLGLDFGTMMNRIADAKASNTRQANAAATALSLQLLAAAQGGPTRTPRTQATPTPKYARPSDAPSTEDTWSRGPSGGAIYDPKRNQYLIPARPRSDGDTDAPRYVSPDKIM